MKNAEIYSTGNVKVDANAKNNINTTVVGGAGSGVAAITGVVNTMTSLDEVHASVENSDITTSASNLTDEDNGVMITAKDDLFLVGHNGTVAGSGVAAVGASVVTGVISNSVNAEILNSDVEATNADIILSATADETLGTNTNPFLTIGATGSGVAAVSGSVDTLVLNSIALSKINGKSTDGVVAGDKVAIIASGKTEQFVSTGTVVGEDKSTAKGIATSTKS